MKKALKNIGFFTFLVCLFFGMHGVKFYFLAWLDQRSHRPETKPPEPLPPPELPPHVEAPPIKVDGNLTDRMIDHLKYHQAANTALGAWNNRLPARIPPAPAWAQPLGAAPRSVIALLTSGATFEGKKTDKRLSEDGLDFTFRVTHYNARSGAIRGEINWTGFDSRHIVAGWLTKDRLRFREVKRIRRGKCPLGLCYSLSFDTIMKAWTGHCMFNFYEDGRLPDSVAADEPDLPLADMEAKNEHDHWPPVEEATNLAKDHDPFSPGSGTDENGEGEGEVTLSLKPLHTQSRASPVKDTSLYAPLIDGQTFRGVCELGRFAYRTVHYNPSTGGIEGRIQWVEPWGGGKDYIDAVTSFSRVSRPIPPHTVHMVHGSLVRQKDLTLSETFPGNYLGLYRLAIVGSDHLEGHITLAYQGRFAESIYSTAVQMHLPNGTD